MSEFCGACGLLLDGLHGDGDGDGHERCAASLRLEPPRFCGACGRRMVVQVTPGGWWATCSRHGRIGAA